VVKQNTDRSFKALVIAGGAGGDSDVNGAANNNPCCNAQTNKYGNGTNPGPDEFNMNFGSSGKGDS